MNLHKSLAALLCAVALTACEKNAVRDLTGPLPGAGIRFFNFALGAPAVQFYAGDTKITATYTETCRNAANPPVTANDTLCLAQGVEATTGITFGGVTSGRRYTAIVPGQYTFSGRTTAAADKGTVVSTVPATIEAGKFYSYYQSGTFNATTKTSDGFIVEDDFPAKIDWTVSMVRLVNAVSNAPPVTLYARNLETNQEYTIGGAVAYKEAGDFVEIPPGTYNLRARATGATTDSYTVANVAFEPGTVYTMSTRGDFTSTSTTAVNRRFLDNTINR